MHTLRNSVRRVYRFSPRRGSLVYHRNASRIAIPFEQPEFPVIESCPPPTCPCREKPTGLEIDRDTNLNGSIGTYAQQVLISTGRSIWKSRIEEDDDALLLKLLKSFLGRGGKYSNPYHNVLLTNTSFARDKPPTRTTGETAGRDQLVEKGESGLPGDSDASVILVPSFQYIPSIPTNSPAVEEFIQAFILPEQLHPAHESLTPEQRDGLLRQRDKQSRFSGARDIEEILVLICGHGGRDERCGVYGPLLQAEFEDKLQQLGISLQKEASVDASAEKRPSDEETVLRANVGLISHIGGHKFAGNVIVYIPPSFSRSPLAGKGIWYGRVGPEHVEGIVEQTILGGKVIKELFRGGIERDGKMLRL